MIKKKNDDILNQFAAVVSTQFIRHDTSKNLSTLKCNKYIFIFFFTQAYNN